MHLASSTVQSSVEVYSAYKLDLLKKSTVCYSLTHSIIYLDPFSLQLLPALEKTAKELEEKVEGFDRLKDMETKVVDLQKELLWAQVIEIELVRVCVCERENVAKRVCTVVDIPSSHWSISVLGHHDQTNSQKI